MIAAFEGPTFREGSTLLKRSTLSILHIQVTAFRLRYNEFSIDLDNLFLFTHRSKIRMQTVKVSSVVAKVLICTVAQRLVSSFIGFE